MTKDKIIEKTMLEFKQGKLRSGSGDIVTKRSQALAIALSKANSDKFAEGGKINENLEMINSDNKAIIHHAEELKIILKKNKDIPTWAVALINQSENNLSNVTHYLDGKLAYDYGGMIPEIIQKVYGENLVFIDRHAQERIGTINNLYPDYAEVFIDDKFVDVPNWRITKILSKDIELNKKLIKEIQDTYMLRQSSDSADVMGLEMMKKGGKLLIANLGAYLLAGETAQKIAPKSVSALDQRIAERLNPTKPSIWEDRGLQYSGGGGVPDKVMEISISRLKSEFRNEPQIFSGKIIKRGPNEIKIENDILYIKRPNENWQEFRLIKFGDGGGVPYKYPKYNLPIYGTYVFKTPSETFELEIYMSERRNDTEDSLVVEEVKNSNVQLGSIIVKNSALNRLTKGLRVKAKSSIGNYSGTIEKILDEHYSNGGRVTKYQDLSKIPPTFVNDTIMLNEFQLKQPISKFEIENQISNSEDAVRILRKIWEKDTINAYEQSYILFLNQRNKVIGFYHHSKGGIDATIMNVQMISGMALKSLSKGVVMAHNHPSGSITPSDADIKVTKEMYEALKLFRIPLLDSIILTENNYTSLADSGLLNR